MLEDYLKSKKNYVDEKIEDFLPKIIDEEWLNEHPHLNQNKAFFVNEIISPVWEFLERGGKRWRPLLMLLCCEAVGGDPKKVEKFISIVEIIHNGTLIIDDIEDDSDTRRGKPCMHKIFGIDVAINTGNLMYYLPSLLIKKANLDSKTKLAIYELINEEMLNLSIGQGMDIHWHNGGDHLDEDQYIQMCKLKTGTLARMSAKLGAILGNASVIQIRSLEQFAETLGVSFQIQDDILNISNQDWGKDFGDDISEGKRTLMVIKVLKAGSAEDKETLMEILDMKTKDRALIDKAIQILQKYDTINYAKQKAEHFIKDAWAHLNSCLHESEAKQNLKLFADFVVNRNV